MFAPIVVGQDTSRRKKPVLIRADRTSDPAPELEIVEPDPVQAKKNLEVGDFYFRKKNFKAAAERYRDAVRYGPKSSKSYSKLVRALEKLEAFLEAAEACNEFIQQNPESNKVPEFQRKAVELDKKIAT